MILRSYLFVPGDSPRKMARALESGADALILDLEDAVAPERKAEARAEVAAFLARDDVPMRRYVRVNALATGLAAGDVAATCPNAPDGYVLPKCEGPGDLDALSSLIAGHGGDGSGIGDGAGIGIMAIATETVRAVRSLMRHDWSHPALAALCWGGEDLAADLGADRNRDESGTYFSVFGHARDLTLLAAVEAGVAAVDAVYTDLADPDGLVRETRQAKALGFSGKLAIHPRQIPLIHEALRPDATEVAWAEAIVAAFADSKTGVLSLNGQMIDRPHLLRAQRILGLEQLSIERGML